MQVESHCHVRLGSGITMLSDEGGVQWLMHGGRQVMTHCDYLCCKMYSLETCHWLHTLLFIRLGCMWSVGVQADNTRDQMG